MIDAPEVLQVTAASAPAKDFPRVGLVGHVYAACTQRAMVHDMGLKHALGRRSLPIPLVCRERAT